MLRALDDATHLRSKPTCSKPRTSKTGFGNYERICL